MTNVTPGVLQYGGDAGGDGRTDNGEPSDAVGILFDKGGNLG